jgi:hypothetical protein
MLSLSTRRPKTNHPRAKRNPERAAAERGALTHEGYAERRDLDRAQDSAVYSCGCGMVFDATVSTSVSCPHCGSSQAW